MPIFGDSPADCFNTFREHIAAFVADVITGDHPILWLQAGPRLARLGFRQQDFRAIPLNTRFGRIFFSAGQMLEAVDDAEHGYRLETLAYSYRIQGGPSLKESAVLRWEYDRTTPKDGTCRHHGHAQATVSIGEGELDLDKTHLPTGWVLVEEVARFLIVELKLSPPCGESWPEAIGESERRFFEDFSGKGYAPIPK